MAEEIFEGPEPFRPRVGLIAWMLTIIAVLSIFFMLIDPNANPRWMLYGFGLSFGVASAALTAIILRSETKSLFYRQSEVLVIGLTCGSVMAIMQAITVALFKVLPFSTGGTESGSLAAPISEDYIFIFAFFGVFYLLFQGMPALMRFIMAGVPTSLVFALWHYFAYGIAAEAIVVLFIGGLIMRWAFIKTGDIGASMLAHMMNNALASIGLLVDWFNTYYLLLLVPVALILILLVFVVCRGDR